MIAVLVTIGMNQQTSHAAEINHLNEVTHLEIPNVTPADYTIKKNNEVLEISIEGLPDSQQNKLKAYSDRFINKIDIKKSTSLSKDIITFYLSDKNIEIFDYLTDSPSTLSIDLFAKDESKEVDAEYEMAQKLNKKKYEKSIKDKTAGRDIASAEFIKTIGHVTVTGDTSEVKKHAETEEEKIKKRKEVNKDLLRIVRLAKQDSEDILRFDTDKINFSKDSLIEGRNRIYIKYPVLLSEHKYVSDILQKDVQYEFKKSDDVTTQDFLKLRKIYANDDFKNFLKAKKIFIKKHNKTKFDEMINYMEADAYLKIYAQENEKIFYDRALKIYDSLLNKYPDSPVSERTLLLISYLRLQNKQYFEAARSLRSYLTKYEKSPLYENVQLILAQSLVHLHEYKDAKKIYDILFKSESAEIKSAAYYAYGDIFFEERDYNSAIKFYNEALKKFPTEDKLHPNIYFNLGETQFLLGQYKESLNNLRKFIEQHPQHDFASFAWTRMGEIFEMSEVDPKIWKGLFNESYFRFENKLGGAIAKINLLYDQAITAPAKKFPFIIEQMQAYTNKIPLKQANEYLNFKISDAYYEIGQYKNAVEILINHFKTGEVPDHVEKFHKRIGRGLAAQLRVDSENGKIVDGLKLFDETDPLWFKKSERFDFSFYKAELFRQAKLYSKASAEYAKYIKDFENVPNKQELDKSQRLPFLSEVYLRQADCYFHQNQLTLATENLNKTNLKELKPELLNEYYLLNAKILVKNEKKLEAILALQNIEKKNLEEILMLADLQNQSGKAMDAVSSIDKFVEGGVSNTEDRFVVLKKKLHILESSNNKKFPEFLSRFYSEFKDNKFDFEREKYLLFSQLIDQKKTKEAEEVFVKMKPQSYWAKLATELKGGNQWNQKYQKYIDRIPAMQKTKEGPSGSN
ncbi:tetratricopeptide repeat protein [bacterium]|nr:tetratricopeptide repeat protein [bacterium]